MQKKKVYIPESLYKPLLKKAYLPYGSADYTTVAGKPVFLKVAAVDILFNGNLPPIMQHGFIILN